MTAPTAGTATPSDPASVNLEDLLDLWREASAGSAASSEQTLQWATETAQRRPHPPRWDHGRWFRDHHLTSDEGLAALGRIYPQVALDVARSIGQLDPHGPGSLTHPDASRTVYGDGTIVRPIYQPPDAVRITDDDGTTHVRYPDRHGVLRDEPPGRFDADLAEHHGDRGSVLGHGYVAFHTRGAHPYERVVLAIDHIPGPGMEATAAAEGFDSNLKRTFLVDRAMGVVWRSGLLEVYAFALLNNALTEHRAAHGAAAPVPFVRRVMP